MEKTQTFEENIKELEKVLILLINHTPLEIS